MINFNKNIHIGTLYDMGIINEKVVSTNQTIFLKNIFNST